MKCIIWFRKDLRLTDNPALLEAIRLDAKIIPVFILEKHLNWGPGSACKWWLYHSLSALNSQLEGKLVFCHGDSKEILQQLIKETQATAVFWNRRYSSQEIAIDTDIKSTLENKNILVKSFNSHLLHEPWEIKNNQGKPFQVFTPYWKKCVNEAKIAKPIPTPSKINILNYAKIPLDSLDLLPKFDWTKGLQNRWKPGEAGAQERLKDFLNNLSGYKQNRNRPDIEATSFLSPHLSWGEISVRQIWHSILAQIAVNPEIEIDALNFLSEIGWREFSYHLLYHNPTLPHRPLVSKFEKFSWNKDLEGFEKWTKGLTGYPIVDAGMRELWHTGYMHNRVRMIVASFLVKDLLISWQDGEAWFWDTLVDADLANNSASWQWVAGCGADASPYFRIFNPVLQGEKFDPEGKYVRKWVPELACLSSTYIHKPWQANPDQLLDAGITLGKTYPFPAVDHNKARLKALDIYKNL